MAAQITTVNAPAPWSRRYPPLMLIAVAVLVAAFILPSALNLPQSNPSTVLEYAPVPPEDDDPPPPAKGNVSSLGLGSSSSLSAGGDIPPPPPPPPPDRGAGSRPEQKECVEGRQTEDPMSPPCVPFFDGDNGGATYQGVTREEFKVVMYFDVGTYLHTGGGRREPSPRDGALIDLKSEPKPPCDGTEQDDTTCDHILIRASRGLINHFNRRFQTYGREGHFYAYFTSANTPAARRKDAVTLWNRLKPFAVIDGATFNGFNEDFQRAMAGRQILVFQQQAALPNSFFTDTAPLSWGFWPDVERWSRNFVAYMCSNIAGKPVKKAGPEYVGQQRKYGLFYTSDAGYPGLQYFARLTKENLQKQCGIEVAEEATFPKSGFVVDGSDPGADQADAVARFQGEDVTTVLYLGGVEGRFSQNAQAVGYFPEIILAGDLVNDANANGRNQNREVWANARAMTFHIRMGTLRETPGYMAYKEGYPDGDDSGGIYARDMYRDFFMLYQAVQVAGPRLTPDAVDQGFHAIPAKESTNPYIASFFFEPGDYTSVKDAAEQWWDPNERPPGATDAGCYKMIDGGRRHLPNGWPGTDTAFDNPSDPCTGYGGSWQYRLA